MSDLAGDYCGMDPQFLGEQHSRLWSSNEARGTPHPGILWHKRLPCQLVCFPFTHVEAGFAFKIIDELTRAVAMKR